MNDLMVGDLFDGCPTIKLFTVLFVLLNVVLLLFIRGLMLLRRLVTFIVFVCGFIAIVARFFGEYFAFWLRFL